VEAREVILGACVGCKELFLGDPCGVIWAEEMERGECEVVNGFEFALALNAG